MFPCDSGGSSAAGPVVLLLPAWSAAQTLRFSAAGYTVHGIWNTDAAVAPAYWKPGDNVQFSATLLIDDSHLAGLLKAGIKVDGFCLLVTAERTFDADGWMRLPSDERMSTLLTPTGMPIEGGVQGAVTNRFGYGFRTPVDQLVKIPIGSADSTAGKRQVTFRTAQALPAGLPPGIYRVRLDYGVTVGTRLYNLNGETFAYRPFFKGQPPESHLYSPPIRAYGRHAKGHDVDAGAIRPRIPWVLLGNYNSNGYRGVVADEDNGHFGVSGRNLIQDDVILPLYDAVAGRALAYSLEPQFPPDTLEARSNIPWDFSKGEISVQVTGPDGKTVDLGTLPFVGSAGQWPTTRKVAITAWKPAAYGHYKVKATGWVSDVWGNRYEGGGTYQFWIANRMTMATATFQGMAYPVGTRYGRDIGFAPAVPADVTVTAALYVNSDPNNSRTATWSGKASPAGTFGAAQGAKNLLLDSPGEYCAKTTATYTDAKGTLWVCSMKHAGVVYDTSSPIVARGKKLAIGAKYFDRGETRYEGWVDNATEEAHLVHLNYPWQSGDVLLIASEGQGANKIIPTLTYEWKDNPQGFDPKLNPIGATNLQLKTSNGYSPHLFPEYITEWGYYYAGAPRPGFMSRFLVAENGTRAPYWPTSPNSFGGQVNASYNGDLPGDIYRLIGGVVLRRPNESPAYAGYLASAFLLPKGTNNNRVIAPGSEELAGPTGQKSRIFLVGTRPGLMYETGTQFAPAVQIDPVLPVNISFNLYYPDGRRVSANGTGDPYGTFVGKDKWVLDTPGIYRYTLEGEWNGYRAIMPGLPTTGGEFYVVEKGKDPYSPEINLYLPPESVFDPLEGIHITGSSSAQQIYYAAVIPGAVIDQGYVPVHNGRFDYFFNPTSINAKTPTYDVTNRVSGRPEIGDVVHLTLFSEEKSAEGVVSHSFARVIIRGTKVICTK